MDIELYCNNCGKKFSVINERRHIKSTRRFCSQKCCDYFVKNMEKLKRDINKQKSIDAIPEHFNAVSKPLNGDKIVVLEDLYKKSSQRASITASLEKEKIKPSKALVKTKRIDGISKTFETNAYTLRQLYDAVQSKHKKYKESANLNHKSARNTLAEVYVKFKRLNNE